MCFVFDFGGLCWMSEKKRPISMSITVPNRSEPIRTGYLTKRGKERRNWRIRWFELYDTVLVYAENKVSLDRNQIKSN